MVLNELLENIEILSIVYPQNIIEDEIEINKLEYDSRNIEENDVFFCIQGYQTDGHNYVENAESKGAKVIVAQKQVKTSGESVLIIVKDTRKALAIAASNYYGNPKEKLNIIGITGTNGKTTSTFMIKSILESAGYRTGLVGTIANYVGDKKIVSKRTTPESLDLHKLFKDMVDDGVKYCIMEVSSHSLYLSRVYGLTFNEGIFTNLTQDHLDFHKTFENYYNAKFILFKNSKNSIVNMDDEYGKKVISDLKSLGNSNSITYSINQNSNLKAENIMMHSRGSEFDMNYNGEKIHIEINLPGKYNIMNALCSAAACLCEGLSLQQVKSGLKSMEFVPGRCEIVSKKHSLDYDIIVDYAHSPDGLLNILNTAREFTKGKLITVFGCGGDRDTTKRPIMGKIGTDLSDIAIITSDNPRTEEPEKIINDVVKGIEKNNYEIVVNRRDAIKRAMELAKKDDVVVIAGKGHEDYQVLKSGTIHFDEREVISDIIKEQR